MYDDSTFLKTELDYRTNRIRSGMAGSRRASRNRFPRVRRPARGDTAGTTR